MRIKKTVISALLFLTLTISCIPFASASTLIDVDKTVSLTVTSEKKGYTFELYEVAQLTSHDANSTYTTSYDSLIGDIEDVVKSGDTKEILLALDNLTELPDSVVSYGTFNSSEATSKTFDELPQGIFYIKVIGYPAGVKSVSNSVVALPYFDGTDWIYEIEPINLSAKLADDVPTTEKIITNSTQNNVYFTDVSLGDEVDFELRSTTAGSTSMKLTTYNLKDIMDAGLTLNENSFVATLVDEEDTEVYKLSNDEYSVNISQTSEGKTAFDIALSKEFLAENQFYDESVNKFVLTYSAILNENAVIGVDGNLNTLTELEYGDDKIIDSVPGNEVYVYTYRIQANKINEDKAALAGAKFALFKEKTDANNLTNQIGTSTSDDTGKAIFVDEKGNELSLQSGTYYIVETEAPDGYKRLEEPIEINLNVEYNEMLINSTWVKKAPKSGIASVTITNVLSEKETTTTTDTVQTGVAVGSGILLIGLVAFVIFRYLSVKRKQQNK